MSHQEDYARGYSDGYKSVQGNVIPPIAPIGPITPLGSVLTRKDTKPELKLLEVSREKRHELALISNMLFIKALELGKNKRAVESEIFKETMEYGKN